MMIYVSIGIFEHTSPALVSITGSVPFYRQVLRKWAGCTEIFERIQKNNDSCIFKKDDSENWLLLMKPMLTLFWVISRTNKYYSSKTPTEIIPHLLLDLCLIWQANRTPLLLGTMVSSSIFWLPCAQLASYVTLFIALITDCFGWKDVCTSGTKPRTTLRCTDLTASLDIQMSKGKA